MWYVLSWQHGKNDPSWRCRGGPGSFMLLRHGDVQWDWCHWESNVSLRRFLICPRVKRWFPWNRFHLNLLIALRIIQHIPSIIYSVLLTAFPSSVSNFVACPFPPPFLWAGSGLSMWRTESTPLICTLRAASGWRLCRQSPWAEPRRSWDSWWEAPGWWGSLQGT